MIVQVSKVEFAKKYLFFLTIHVVLNGQVIREYLDHNPGYCFPHRAFSEESPLDVILYADA